MYKVHQQIISGFLMAIMLWNIAGWLGTGLIMNHLHAHNDTTHHCEVAFCYCEVDEAETQCTCHHQETATHSSEHNQHQETEAPSNSFCYYNAPHDAPPTASEALIAIAKYQAICLPSSPLNIPETDKPRNPFVVELTASGFTGNLLRPPRA